MRTLPRAACRKGAHAEYVGRCESLATVSLILALVAADAAAAATPKPRLKAFASCKVLVDYARDGALRTHGGVGVRRPRGRPAGGDDRDAAADAAGPTGPATSAERGPTAGAGLGRGADPIGGAVPDFSGTNTQEVDVDEPDIVKTDGRRIFAVTDSTLRVIEIGRRRDRHAHARRVRPPAAAARRPRAGDLEQGRRRATRCPSAGRSRRPSRRLRASRSSPRSTSPAPRASCARWRSPGRFVDARQNGATARLVIDAVPQPFVAPDGGDVDDAVERRRRERFLAPDGASQQPQRQDVQAQPRAVRGRHPPRAVLRPRTCSRS